MPGEPGCDTGRARWRPARHSSDGVPREITGSREDSYWYVIPGGNHNSDIVDLPPAEQLAAANTIRRWAALPPLEPLPPTPPAPSAIAPSASIASTLTPVQRLARSTPLDQLELFAHPPRL